MRHDTVQYQDHRPPRPIFRSMLRGFLNRCPACGKGRLFAGYLETMDRCDQCGEALHHHRADDAPPYFTILIVGHLIVAGVFASEKLWAPPIWLQMTIWLPATLILSLALLRPIKGAIVGLQWALYMHGFDPDAPAEHTEFEHQSKTWGDQ